MSEGMYSFYGGQPGQAFTIKQVFTSYNGTSNSIKSDIEKGWTSPISVGEFVSISYGEPGTTEYETNRNIDLTAEGKAHNCTLWQKTYDEDVGNASGLAYTLIGSMTGNTPKIVVDTPATVLDADQEPAIVYDNSSTDEPHIEFQLPQSQVLQYDKSSDFTELDANEDPDFQLDSSDINKPRIKVSLPQSQVIETAVIEEYVGVGDNPEVRLDISEDGTINSPVLKLKLPVAQEFLEENVSSEVLDANVLPYITFDETNKNTPTLVFYLPQSQVMDDPTMVTIGPDEEPAVEDIGTVNAPKLQFSLPRAVKFYYGSLLGERTAGTYTVTNSAFSEYGVGDYYINATTGFIYKVTSKTSNTTCVFEYTACIQSPLPTVTATAISPYTTEGDTAVPDVVRSFTDNEQTAWQLEFKLPKAPVPILETSFVGSAEEGSASLAITSEDNYTITLTIPTGSKLFSGTEVDTETTSTTIDGARLGDIYLNSSTGVVYELTDSGWVAEEDSLKGPVGDALNIVLYKTYSYSDGVTKDQIPSLLVTEMSNAGLTASAESIISVVYTNDSSEEESFWYVWSDSEQAWKPMPLTGGVGSLLQEEYTTDSTKINDKTYTVAYINSLIGNGTVTVLKDRTAYSKTEIDTKETAINESISTLSGNVYTKEEIDSQMEVVNTAINEAVDTLANDVYTKTEIDAKETTINESIQNIENAVTWGSISDLVESGT